MPNTCLLGGTETHNNITYLLKKNIYFISCRQVSFYVLKVLIVNAQQAMAQEDLLHPVSAIAAG